MNQTHNTYQESTLFYISVCVCVCVCV